MRIKEIVIHFMSDLRYPHSVHFRDELDVLFGLPGRRFGDMTPASAGRLQRVIFNNHWPVDIGFNDGTISVYPSVEAATA